MRKEKEDEEEEEEEEGGRRRRESLPQGQIRGLTARPNKKKSSSGARCSPMGRRQACP